MCICVRKNLLVDLKKILYLNKNYLLDKFNNILLSQLNKKEFNYFRVYSNINKINFNKNFI